MFTGRQPRAFHYRCWHGHSRTGPPPCARNFWRWVCRSVPGGTRLLKTDLCGFRFDDAGRQIRRNHAHQFEHLRGCLQITCPSRRAGAGISFCFSNCRCGHRRSPGSKLWKLSTYKRVIYSRIGPNPRIQRWLSSYVDWERLRARW